MKRFAVFVLVTLLLVGSAFGANFYWKASLADLNAVSGRADGDRGIVIDVSGVVAFYYHSGGSWIPGTIYATGLSANGINCAAGDAARGVDAYGNAEGCWTPLVYSGVVISLPWDNITSTPTTLAGYGITDAASAFTSIAWDNITGTPTTLFGYGITNAQETTPNLDLLSYTTPNRVLYSDNTGLIGEIALGANGTFLKSTGATGVPTFDTPTGSGDMLQSVYDVNSNGVVDFAASVGWAGVTGRPTTLAGYGITDASSAVTSMPWDNVTGKPNVIDNVALAAWTGSTNLTRLGTVTTGVWNGTAVPLANGGTGATSAAGARTNLGLGTVSTQSSSAVAITGGTITGITDLAIADGGTGASTAAQAVSNLGALPLVGSATVTTLGTVTTGVWNATAIPITNGGTGAANVANARTNLGLGTSDNVTHAVITGTQFASLAVDNTHYVNVGNTSDPAGPSAGDCQYNKTSNEWRCYTGSIWQAAAAPADNSITIPKLYSTGGTASASTYFRGDNTWASPPGTITSLPWDNITSKPTTFTPTDNSVTPAKTTILGAPDGTKYLRDDWTWNTPSGSTSPAGADNQIQYKSGASFAAVPGAGYNATDNSTTFPGPVKAASADGYNYINVGNTTNKTTPAQGDCWFNRTTIKWVCRDVGANIDIGPAAAVINDNSILPIKLAKSSGTADSTTWYRGDGAWVTPTSNLPDQTGYSGRYLTTNGSSTSWAVPAGGGDMLASVYTSGGFVTVASGGTGAGTAGNARANLGLGTLSTQAADNVAITGGSIATTGTITGKVSISAHNDNATLSGAELHGSLIEVITAAHTLTLPAKVQGMQFCVVSTGAFVVKLTPNGSDYFVYEGTSLSGASKILNSSGADGDSICIYGSSVANKWYVTGHGKNAWTATGS